MAAMRILQQASKGVTSGCRKIHASFQCVLQKCPVFRWFIGQHRNNGMKQMRVNRFGTKADKINATLVNARFIKPLDTKILDRLALKHKKIVTMEENVKNGGFGMAVSEYMQEYHPEVKVQIIALPDSFITHGNPKLLKAKAGIDADSIYGAIKEAEKR